MRYGYPGTEPIGGADRLPDLPPILSDDPESFAWHVWHDRHPALLAQLRDAHPYPPSVLTALDDLLAETLTGVIRPLPDTAADHAAWREWGAGTFGRPWLAAPFLWTESYFYRRLLEAVGFFAPGAWRGVDPFQFLKTAELAAPALDDDLRALDTVAALPAPERTVALLQASLWGNRADLGFRIGVAARSGQLGAAAHLVADDTAATVARLGAAPPGTVCVVADNAGPDLLSDLALIDHLLRAGLAERAVLHVKPYPYYVSDAVTTDLVQGLYRLARPATAAGGPAPGDPAAAGGPAPGGPAPGEAGEVARRLRAAAAAGRFAVHAHWFHCAPFPYHRMPADLAAEFAAATLVIFKGDLNYRRLVGDHRWPETTPFAETVAYFPAPVAALRILKSEVVVGLDAGRLAALERTTGWRTNGRYGLLQMRG